MTQNARPWRLLEPIRIGPVELRNRLVLLPMENNYASPDGLVTERLQTYYGRRARDVGLVLIQIASVESTAGTGYAHLTAHEASPGKGNLGQLYIDDDRQVPGLSQLARTIHEAGAKTFIQLHHAGANARGVDIAAASPVPLLPGMAVPRAMTRPEIEEIIGRFVAAAIRARTAGFDGVEVVASGNYLVWNFLSPNTNKRQDEYGGSLAGRAKLLLDIVRAIRTELGADYPISCRLGAKEYETPEGVTISDTKQIARWAVDAGLSAITITAVGGDSLASPNPGVLVPLARAIKQAVTVPVTVAGRMDVEVGERAIASGSADLVGIGRRLLADPDYVSKALAGKTADITPCIACKMCIDLAIVRDEPLRCAVNPACGRENELALQRADKAKDVLVVGGGPGGMQAAIVAALRGHRVTLCESSESLGGQLLQASLPPGKSVIAPLIAHLVAQVEQNGVRVELDRWLDSAAVEQLTPDAVVVATGRNEIVPPIVGIEKASVAAAGDVLTGRAVTGIDVAVIGGDLVGCETAEYLADKGTNVTVVEALDRPLSKTSPIVSARLLRRLAAKGVRLVVGAKREEFRDNCLVVTAADGGEIVIPADTIVYAAGGTPNDNLYQMLRPLVPEVWRVGDCVEVRDIAAAIEEGYNVGRML